MKKLYVGIDLHSNNNVIGMLNQDDKRIFSKRLPNMPDVILSELFPYKDEITGIVVESTFNWYWLVDLLLDNGYKVHLANPVAMQKYSGLKYADDKHDAFWLAHLLRLKILPEGYIYPREYRPVRDLLRKRMQLVNQRSSVITSLQAILYRNCGSRLSTAKIKAKTQNHVAAALPDQDELQFGGTVSKQTIDFLTQQIESIEKRVEESIREKSCYHYLKTIPGVGVTLAQTIVLETGEISRFKRVGDFTSYCRKVPTKWTSNTKTKGKGNRKNGNKYLSWAFSEAAEIARRFDDRVRSYYAGKIARTNRMVAHATLAHKFARAAYFVMRDNVEFDHDKLFA
jgi:transposase